MLGSRNVRILTLTRTLNSVGFSATIPFLALYLTVARGSPLWLVGAMYALQGVGALFSQVLSGLISDRFGPKRTLNFGYVTSVASALYMAFLIQMSYPPIVIILTYPLFSFLRGLSFPATATLMADEGTDLVTNMSLLVIAGNLGFALGPAIGGFLVYYIGYAELFLMNAVITVVALLLSLYLREATYHLAREKATARPDSSTIIFLAFTFVGYLVIGQEIEPFAIFAGKMLSVSNLVIGYIFSFSGLLIVVLQLPAMRLLRTRGSFISIITSAALGTAACLYLARSSNVPDLFVGMTLITLAEILFVVPTQIWITRKAPPTRKGAYQGYYSAITTVGRSSASWLGSTALGAFESSPGSAWALMSLLGVVAGVGFALHSAKFHEQPQQ